PVGCVLRGAARAVLRRHRPGGPGALAGAAAELFRPAGTLRTTCPSCGASCRLAGDWQFGNLSQGIGVNSGVPHRQPKGIAFPAVAARPTFRAPTRRVLPPEQSFTNAKQFAPPQADSVDRPRTPCILFSGQPRATRFAAVNSRSLQGPDAPYSRRGIPWRTDH